MVFGLPKGVYVSSPATLLATYLAKCRLNDQALSITFDFTLKQTYSLLMIYRAMDRFLAGTDAAQEADISGLGIN